jgi:hypothetical protein
MNWVVCARKRFCLIYGTVPAFAGETGKTAKTSGFSVFRPKFEPVTFLIEARGVRA